MSIRRRAIAGMTLAIAVAGCVGAPRATVEPAMPTRYREAATMQDTQSVSSDWWTAYQDGVLNGLEAQVAVSNQSLAQALAQLKYARAGIRLAASAGWPQLDAGLSADRSHTSANVVGRALAGRTVNDHALTVSASWEPDLFGRIAHQVQAARADADAAAADADGLRLALQSELAEDYLTLRSVDREVGMLDRFRAHAGELAQMTQRQLTDGTASEQDVDQSQAAVELLEAQSAALRGQRAALEHAIATLLNKPAGAFSVPVSREPMRDFGVSAGIPSELLRRRPDIAAAQRRVEAANARAGIARLAWFPQLVLSVTGGLESTALPALFALPSRSWALGPSMLAPLLDGGRRRANLDQAEAGVDAAAADYQGKVVSAINEVEDQLAGLASTSEELKHQNQALQLSRRAREISEIRYRTGTGSYLEVLVAQDAEVSSERQALLVERRLQLIGVALVRALGGGWQPG